MHGSGGQFLLLLILVGVSLGILASTVSRARAAHRSAPGLGRGTARVHRADGPGTGVRGRTSRRTSFRVPGAGWLEHRRRIALERERHRLGLLRDWARHRMRMREREAAAPTTAAPDAPAAGTPGPAQPQGGNIPRQRPRHSTVPGTVLHTDDGPAGGGPAGSGPAPAAPAASAGTSPSPPPSPGGSTVSTGAVEQAVEGTQHIHARAAAGNIRAKQWAIKACAELFTRISAMMLMLSRTLAEQRYGPEITEPLAQASQFAQAAALACGQSDAGITSLANMTVGELADSPRQAPHHSQLEENGSGTGWVPAGGPDGSAGWVQRPWLSETGQH